MAFSFALFTAIRSLLQREGLPTNAILYIAGTQGFGKSQLAKRYCMLFDDNVRKLPGQQLRCRLYLCRYSGRVGTTARHGGAVGRPLSLQRHQ